MSNKYIQTKQYDCANTCVIIQDLDQDFVRLKEKFDCVVDSRVEDNRRIIKLVAFIRDIRRLLPEDYNFKAEQLLKEC